MNLKEALEVREKNKGLVGKIYSHEWRIVNVFAAPIEDKSFTKFLSMYAQTRDNTLSLMPFAEQTMTVKVRWESLSDPSVNVYFIYDDLSEVLNNKR